MTKQNPKVTSYTLDQKKPKKKLTTKQWIIIGASALLCTGLVFLCIFLYKVFNPSAAFDSETKAETAVAQTPSPSNTTTAAVKETDPYETILKQSDLNFMKDKVNILILGIDRNAAREDWGSFRTDTMMLATCDFKQKKMAMVSLPRDSLVYICPFNVMARINTAFGHGGGEKKDGYEYAMKTVSQQLGGIPVNHYIGFDMEVVKSVVDAMGGVDYFVDTVIEVDGRSVPQGQQHLNGLQVLDYCRMRHGSSDIMRVDRQQRMLFEIIKQLKSKDQVKNLPDIYKAVESNIRTNLDFTQICSLILFAKDLNLETMQRYTLPGEFLNIDGDSYWGIVQSKKAAMVKEIFGISIQGNSKENFSRLKDLSDRKIKASSSGKNKISEAQSFINANGSVVTASEKSKFNQLKDEIQTLINKKNVTLLQSIVESLESKVNELNAWLNELKTAVSGRNTPSPSTSEATPTSPPLPSGS